MERFVVVVEVVQVTCLVRSREQASFTYYKSVSVHTPEESLNLNRSKRCFITFLLILYSGLESQIRPGTTINWIYHIQDACQSVPNNPGPQVRYFTQTKAIAALPRACIHKLTCADRSTQ